MKLETAINKAFDKCNLIGEDCDVYKVITSYKAIRELSEQEIENVYSDIVARLGFTE